MILMILPALRISQCRNNTYGLTWFIIFHDDIRLNLKPLNILFIADLLLVL